MDWLTNLIWHGGKLFGIDWSVWKSSAGSATRFFHAVFGAVVCHGKEEAGRGAAGVLVVESGRLADVSVVLPFTSRIRVFIFAYAFTWIPYIRNLIIHRRHKKAHTDCAGCGKKIPPQSNFCPNCGVKVA